MAFAIHSSPSVVSLFAVITCLIVMIFTIPGQISLDMDKLLVSNVATQNINMFHAKNWKQLLAYQARMDNTITLTMVDHDYKQIAKPWYLQALRINLNNCVIVALDDEAYKQAIDERRPVIRYECLVNECHPLVGLEKEEFISKFLPYAR